MIPIPIEELGKVLAEIAALSMPPGRKGVELPVKYVEPVVDTRIGVCFAMKLRPWWAPDQVMLDYRDGVDLLGAAFTGKSPLQEDQRLFADYVLDVVRNGLVKRQSNPLTNNSKGE